MCFLTESTKYEKGTWWIFAWFYDNNIKIIARVVKNMRK